MRVRRDVGSECLMALQAGFVRIHHRPQLRAPRPFHEIGLFRIGRVHFVTGDARKISAAETRRCLHCVELAAGDANHAVAPKAVREEAGLCFPNEILLFGVVRGIGLDNETLGEVLVSGAETRPLAIKINFLRHVIECPNAMALPAVQTRCGPGEPRWIADARVRLRGEMQLESADRIAI